MLKDVQAAASFISVRVPPSRYDQIFRAAADEGLSIAGYCRRIVYLHLDRNRNDANGDIIRSHVEAA